MVRNKLVCIVMLLAVLLSACGDVETLPQAPVVETVQQAESVPQGGPSAGNSEDGRTEAQVANQSAASAFQFTIALSSAEKPWSVLAQACGLPDDMPVRYALRGAGDNLNTLHAHEGKPAAYTIPSDYSMQATCQPDVHSVFPTQANPEALAGGAAAAALVAPNLKGRMIENLPPQFEPFMREATANGKVVASTGTLASTVVIGQFEEVSMPDLARSHLLSYDRMCDIGASWLCFGRPDVVDAKGAGSMGATLNVNLDALKDEPGGLGLIRSGTFADKFGEVGAYDLGTAAQNLDNLQRSKDLLTPLVQKGAATEQQVKNFPIISARYDWAAKRAGMYVSLTPEHQAVVQEAWKTGLVLVWDTDLSELSRNNTQWGYGVGSTVLSGEKDLAQVRQVYVLRPVTNQLRAYLQAAVPNAQIIILGEDAETVALVQPGWWSRTWAAAQPLAYQAGFIADQALNVWLPTVGFYAMILTPAGVWIGDRLEVADDWQPAFDAAQTDLSLDEWQELFGNASETLSTVGCDGLGNCLFDPVISLAEAAGTLFPGWTETDVATGGSTDVRLKLAVNQMIDCHEFAGLASDCPAPDGFSQNVRVSYLGFTGGRPTALVGDDTLVLNSSSFTLGCYEPENWLGYGIDRRFQIRYILDSGGARLFFKPDFRVIQGCPKP